MRSQRTSHRSFGSLLSLLVIILIAGAAITAPLLTSYPEQGRGRPNPITKLQPPSAEHPFGTDHLGRDLLARVLFGGRIALLSMLFVVGLSIAIGVPLGALAGFAGGWVDELIMRSTDVFLSFPALLLAIAVATALGPSMLNSAIAIALSWWPWYARIARSQVLAVRQRSFVLAAQAVGVPAPIILLRHLLPHTYSAIIVQATFDAGAAMLTVSALAFLGLGAPPPTPDWGEMVSAGRIYFPERWWYATFPGMAVFLTTMAFNVLGDSLPNNKA